MKSKLVVVASILVIVMAVVAALGLRSRMRCAGFVGPGVSASELPAPPAPGALRVAHFNLRNFPLDERPNEEGLGYSRRTNICDLETVLDGLGADVMGFVEVCDTRRFPPILKRACVDRSMEIRFSPGGGATGQHLAVAWNAARFRLLEPPQEIADVVVKPGLRPGFAVRLGSITDPTLDFTVVELHLDAGRNDLRYRVQQVRVVADWVASWVENSGDADVIVLGDLNTVGGKGVSPGDELRLMDALLGGAGLTRLANETGCSQYWNGPEGRDGVFHASLLDHIYLRGLDAAGPARSWLHCDRLQCGDLISRPGEEDGTFFDVSDHCPVTFEVVLD